MAQSLVLRHGETTACADHAHDVAAVAGADQSSRGLTCNNCNAGVGFFKDDPSRLLRAVEYLLSPPVTPGLRRWSEIDNPTAIQKAALRYLPVQIG
jgi:hypothetical protein